MTDRSWVEDYLGCFARTWPDDAQVDGVRFVALDSETTGLDPRKDRIISIGAVAVRGGEIDLQDGFEALLKISHNTSAVTVHGITREESQSGLDEAEALRLFLGYLRDGVIVGHHIAHDITCLNVGCERSFGSQLPNRGFQLRNRSLDTMALALLLEQDGAFAGRDPIQEFSLDSLLAMFGINPHDRHTAPGDAFLTAQLFQRLLRLAARYGRTSLASISQSVPGPE